MASLSDEIGKLHERMDGVKYKQIDDHIEITRISSELNGVITDLKAINTKQKCQHDEELINYKKQLVIVNTRLKEIESFLLNNNINCDYRIIKVRQEDTDKLQKELDKSS